MKTYMLTNDTMMAKHRISMFIVSAKDEQSAHSMWHGDPITEAAVLNKDALSLIIDASIESVKH